MNEAYNSNPIFFFQFYAQRPKHDWQIQAGLHIVDLYPVGKSLFSLIKEIF